MPYMLKAVLLSVGGGASEAVQFDPLQVFVKLIFTVLVPSIIGFVLRRESAAVLKFVTLRKVELSLFSSANLVCIIWQTLSAASDSLKQQSAVDLVSILVTSIFFHVFLLCVMYVVSSPWGFNIPARERVAIIIMCAQKSGPVSIQIM